MSDTLKLLEKEIAKLIVDALDLENTTPEDIDLNAPLFDGGLGLDSIDALEIGATISKHYNLKIKSQSNETASHFTSVHTLALFVQEATKNMKHPERISDG